MSWERILETKSCTKLCSRPGCGVLFIGYNGSVKTVNVPKSTQNFSGQHVAI